MRYADGPTVEVEVYIAAPIARVWELVSDINLPGRFSDEFKGGHWLDGATAPEIGARFRGRNHHPAIGEWETTSFVTECDQERVLTWVVNNIDNPHSSWSFELHPEDEGTRLRQRARIGPGLSGVLLEIRQNPHEEERIIERRQAEHRANMHRVVEGIKALAEAAT